MTKQAFFLFLLLFVVLFFSSCASHKKYTFGQLGDLQSLNGMYLNTDNVITRAFNLSSEGVDLVTLEFADAKTLHLSLLSDSGFTQARIYKGNLKKNNKYFEVVFERIFRPFIVFSQISSDKVRLGRDADGNPFINKEEDSFGNFLCFVGGYDNHYGEPLNTVSNDTPVPTKTGDKWGFSTLKGETIIAPKYDFVRMYQGDVARVKIGKTWGLIDKEGDLLTPKKYKRIDSFDKHSGLARVVTWDNKVGVINKEGVEVIPAVYDEIGYLQYDNSIAVSYMGDKCGYVTLQGELFPPVFDKASINIVEHSSRTSDKGRSKPDFIGDVVIGKVSYAIDRDGYIYEYKKSPWIGSTIDYSSKCRYESKIDGMKPVDREKEQNRIHQPFSVQ